MSLHLQSYQPPKRLTRKHVLYSRRQLGCRIAHASSGCDGDISSDGFQRHQATHVLAMDQVQIANSSATSPRHYDAWLSRNVPRVPQNIGRPSRLRRLSIITISYHYSAMFPMPYGPILITRARWIACGLKDVCNTMSFSIGCDRFAHIFVVRVRLSH